MKIAYIVPKLKDSGLTIIPFCLAKTFSQFNEIKIFYLSETESPSDNLSLKVPVQKIKLTQFLPELNDYNIIHSHGLLPDLYILLHSNEIKAITITTIHGYHFDELRYDKGLLPAFIFGNLWNFAAQKFKVAACISQAMAKYYQNLGFTNTVVIYNGIQEPTIERNHVITNNLEQSKKIEISTVSILNKRKGVDLLVKLLQLNEQYHLTAIGGNTKNIERLQGLADQLNVAHRCKFLSHQKNPWKIAIESNVFIFPSRSEGFGLALIEAAFLKIPIICSDIPTFREIFEEDEVTFFQLDNIHDLNEKVLELDKLKYKTQKAKLKVEQKFSLEIMCNNYYQLYSTIK